MRHSCTNPCIKKNHNNKKQHSGKRGYVNERLIMQDTVGWRRLMHWNSHHNKGPSKGPCSHILPRGHTGIAGSSVPAGAAVWAQGHAWSWPGCGDSTAVGLLLLLGWSSCLGRVFLENPVCSRKALLIEKESKSLYSSETF